MNPTTGSAGCCARATSGHAAALPIPAMNSRRRICHASEPLYGQPIAINTALIRANAKDCLDCCGI
jgi:hypothetical protein